MKWYIIVASWQNWEDIMSTDQLTSDEPEGSDYFWAYTARRLTLPSS